MSESLGSQVEAGEGAGPAGSHGDGSAALATAAGTEALGKAEVEALARPAEEVVLAQLHTWEHWARQQWLTSCWAGHWRWRKRCWAAAMEARGQLAAVVDKVPGSEDPQGQCRMENRSLNLEQGCSQNFFTSGGI
ncbi:UNVERIFIED_CONTAM: hypothetical protein K2H54_025868 [Gekko kuhli]